MSDAATVQPLTDEEKERLAELQAQDRLKKAEQEEHDALVARHEAAAAEAAQAAVPDYHARLNADINAPPEATDMHPQAAGAMALFDSILAALMHIQATTPSASGLGNILRQAAQHLHLMKLDAGDPAAKAVEAAKAPPPE